MKSFFETFLPALAADRDVAEYRISVCGTCPNFTKKRRCTLCGCFMDIKTKIGSMTCPDDKW